MRPCFKWWAHNCLGQWLLPKKDKTPVDGTLSVTHRARSSTQKTTKSPVHLLFAQTRRQRQRAEVLLMIFRPASIFSHFLQLEFGINVQLLKQRPKVMFSLTFKIIDHLELAIFPSETSMLIKNCLQCCVRFCHTTMRISHNYTFIHPLCLKPPSPPQPHLPRSSQSTGLGSVHFTATSHQPSILDTICTYVGATFSIRPTHSLPHSVHKLFSTSVSPFLPCKYVHQYHYSIYIH